MSENIVPEEWRPVVGYEGIYEVSNHGRVKRVSGGQGARVGGILKFIPTKAGYSTVSLCMDCKPKMVLVHRLVAGAFIEKTGGRNVVNHKNFNKKDNRVENLEWTTHSENIRHSFKFGVRSRPSARGTCNRSAKLTDEEVMEIRKSTDHCADIALRYDIHWSQVYRIKQKKAWSHIP